MDEERSIRKCGKNEGMMMMLRKGPWKAEEDQVLLNHVQKYGPRDWSSIRSKGLLQRTGKSCRLRWVNKLRPNLKNGCKFTSEEERVVIELQAQWGNKWARIAKHLPGRTDNDVKNFWSSRQKRLARLLQSQSPVPLPISYKLPSSSSSSTTCTIKRKRTSPHKVPKSSSLMEGETSSKRQHSTSAPYTSTNTCREMIPFPDVENHSSLDSEANTNQVKLEPFPLDMKYPNSLELPVHEPFPSIPHLQTDLPFPPETQELIERLDSSFLEPFGCLYEPALLDDGVQLVSCFGGDIGSGSQLGASDESIAPDSFFDDFPADVFDQIEPLPSPSNW